MRRLRIEDQLSSDDRQLLYNGLDSAITFEVDGILEKQLTYNRAHYGLSLDLQAPVLDMNTRGVLLHKPTVGKLRRQYTLLRDRLQRSLDELAQVIWDQPLNPRSPKQVIDFFSHMHLKLRSSEEDELLKFKDIPCANQFVKHIVEIRDASKKLSVLKALPSPDFRARCSYRIDGTKTTRFNSKEDIFGHGTNQQNITPELRRCFVADPGYILVSLDLKQADSHYVALTIRDLFGDESYLRAHLANDLHVYVTKMVWPELPWTGDAQKDREIADQILFSIFSYRDTSKRVAHGTNFWGTAAGIAQIIGIPVGLVTAFQPKYFRAFPGISKWQEWVIEKLQTQGYIETLDGRRHYFWGRSDDEATQREAIACGPQSTTAHATNRALRNIWRWEGVALPQPQVLLQVHDSIVTQVPEHQVLEYIPPLLEKMRVPISGFVVPSDVQIGWNWGKYNKKDPKDNPDGLIDFRGVHDRQRQDNPTADFLD